MKTSMTTILFRVLTISNTKKPADRRRLALKARPELEGLEEIKLQSNLGFGGATEYTFSSSNIGRLYRAPIVTNGYGTSSSNGGSTLPGGINGKEVVWTFQTSSNTNSVSTSSSYTPATSIAVGNTYMPRFEHRFQPL